MSDVRTLADKLKAAADVSNTAGLNVLMTDASGNLMKTSSLRFNVIPLSNMEEKRSVMTLKDFTQKYVEGTKVGTLLTDWGFSDADTWFVDLKDGVRINVQAYSVEVLKLRRTLSTTWACITLLFRPASPAGSYMYLAVQTTGATAADYSVTVMRIPFETV